MKHKLTKTFYYQYGNQYASQVAFNTFTTPAEILPESASIYISVPFKVKMIHIKSITYTAGQNGGQGNPNLSNYITFTSSLVGNRPVGMVHRDSQYSMSTKQDIEHTFQIPIVVNGYYSFPFFSNDGTNEFWSLTNTVYPYYYVETLNPPFLPEYDYWFDAFSITIEFHGEE